MLDQLKWLGKEEEIRFEQKKFKGELAGKSWKYSMHLDSVIRVRAVIFIMSILMFYRVLTNYLAHDYFTITFFIERLIYAVLLIFAGLMYNKVRYLALVIALAPLGIILIYYLTSPGQFNIKIIAFQGAIFLLVLYGGYNNYKLKQLKRELELFLPENHLVE